MTGKDKRPPRSRAPNLRRDITWALAVKIVALGLLYVAFFGPAHRVTVTPDRIAAVIVGSVPSDRRP